MNQIDPNTQTQAQGTNGGQQPVVQTQAQPQVQPQVQQPAPVAQPQPQAMPQPVPQAAPVAQQPAPVQAVTAPQPVAQPAVAQAPAVDLSTVKTKSGKGLSDFEIPAAFLQSDPALVKLVMESESMNDGERQYWFNLTEIMSPDQVQKLRDILTRERQKLAEIEAKYGKPKVELSPQEVAQKNAEMERRRDEQQARLEERERRHQAEEAEKEAAILAELESL